MGVGSTQAGLLWRAELEAPSIYHTLIALEPADLRAELEGLVAARPAAFHSLCDSFGALGDLSRLGFERLHDSEWYVRPAGAVSAPVTELEIDRVTTRTELAEWEAVAQVGFGNETPAAPFAVHAPGILEDPAMHVLAGRRQGRIVSVAMAYVTRVNGIYSVATLPEHRRRGHGDSITRAALLVAPELTAVLEPSQEGAPLYLRLGFTSVGTLARWNRWLPAAR